MLADDDPRRVQVIVERPALAQELRREEQVLGAEASAGLRGVTHRHGGLDHHHRARIDRHHVLDHRLDARGIEGVGLGVVVGGGRDHHEVGLAVGGLLVQGRREVQLAVGQELADLGILDGRAPLVQHRDPLRDDIHRHDPVVLGQQHGVGETDVAGTGNGNVHSSSLCFKL